MAVEDLIARLTAEAEEDRKREQAQRQTGPVQRKLRQAAETVKTATDRTLPIVHAIRAHNANMELEKKKSASSERPSPEQIAQKAFEASQGRGATVNKDDEILNIARRAAGLETPVSTIISAQPVNKELADTYNKANNPGGVWGKSLNVLGGIAEDTLDTLIAAGGRAFNAATDSANSLVNRGLNLSNDLSNTYSARGGVQNPEASAADNTLREIAAAESKRTMIEDKQAFDADYARVIEEATAGKGKGYSTYINAVGALGQMLATSMMANVTAGNSVVASGLSEYSALAGKGLKELSNLAISSNAAGQSYIDAMAEGAGSTEAASYALLSGALEYGTNKLFGGNPILDRDAGAFNKLVGKITNNEKLLSFLGSMPVELVGEGVEEAISEIMSPVLQRLTYNPDADFATLEQIVDSAIQGILVAGFAEGGRALSRMGGRGTNIEKPETLSSNEFNGAENAPGVSMDNSIAEPGRVQTGENESGTTGISAEDYANSNSPVWNNVPYDDIETRNRIQANTHKAMVDEGKVVAIPEAQNVQEAYPDLRNMSKSERVPILKEKMQTLKQTLREFLRGLRGVGFEFEVNGNVLEARLYDTGIREVLSKVNQDKANMLLGSDAIFRNAEYLYSTPDYDSDQNIYRWNYFYTPIQIGDGDIQGVRIAVRDMVPKVDGKLDSQIYNWGIKREATLDGGRPGQKPNTTGVSSVASPETSLISADHADQGTDLAQGAGQSPFHGSTAARAARSSENANEPLNPYHSASPDATLDGGGRVPKGRISSDVSSAAASGTPSEATVKKSTAAHTPKASEPVPSANNPIIAPEDGIVNKYAQERGIDAPEGRDSVGAMRSEHEQKVSGVGTRTLSNSEILNNEQKERFKPETLTYTATTNEGDIRRASDRLRLDYDGTAQEIARDGIESSEDLHAAFALLADALQNGEAGGRTVRQWMQTLADAGANGGQIVQAFSVYAHTPAGKVTKAQEAVNEAANSTERAKETTAAANQLIDDVVQVKDDALNLIREIHEVFSTKEHGAPDWVEALGTKLAQAMRSRLNPRTAGNMPLTKTMLNDLIKFAENYGLPKKKPTSAKRSAIDRIADWFNNREAYAKAWNSAQNQIRTRYKDNPDALDALDGWLNGTIGYAGQGSDAVMLGAVAEAALANDTSAKEIVVRRGVGDREALESELYNYLASRIHPEGADADILRGAVSRYVAQQAGDASGILEVSLKRAMKDMGIKMSEIIAQGAETKAALGQNLSAMLVDTFHISRDVADSAGDIIATQFNNMVAERAQKALESRFKEKKKKPPKEFHQKLRELANMGAFTSTSPFRDIAFEKLGIPNLSDAELNEIFTLMQQANDAETGSYEANLYEARANKIIADKMPKPLRSKIGTMLIDNMLGNLKTLITRNAGGNVLFAIPESVSRAGAILTDSIVGKKTGARTLAVTKGRTKAYIKGFGKGFADTFRDFKNDVVTPKSGETLEYQAQQTPFSSRVPNFLDKLVRTGLTLGDRPFYEANYAARMTELQKLKKRGKLSADFAENFDKLAQVEAQLYALEAVFQGDSDIAKALSHVRGFFGNFIEGVTGVSGTGQLAVPFYQTPGNMAQRVVEYMPGIGLVKNIAETAKEVKKGNFDQRRFSTQMGRQLTGTGIAAAGVLGTLAGALTGGGDNDRMKEETGWQAYSVKIGDHYYTYDWIPIVGSLLAGAADATEAYKSGEKGISNLIGAVGAGLGTVTESTALQGINRMFGSYGSLVSGVGDTLIGATSQLVPSVVRQVANSTDEYARQTYDPNPLVRAYNKLISGIPWARQTLPILRDVYGEPVKQNDGRSTGSKLLENMVSPGYLSSKQNDPVAEEYSRLGINIPFTPKTITYQGEKYKLSADEYNQYGIHYGNRLAELSKPMLESSKYANMSDAEKAETLESIKDTATSFARAAFFEGRGVEYTVTGDGRLLPEAEAAGVSADEWAEYRIKYDEIDQMNKSNAVKDAYLAQWLSRQDYTAEQQDFLRKQTGYWTSMQADAGKYDELVKAGLSTEKSLKLYDGMSWFSNPNDLTKAQYIDKVTYLNNREKLKALSVYLSDSAYQKYATANSYGIDVEDWTKINKAISKLGNVNQENAKIALEQADWLTDEERAYGWAILCAHPATADRKETAASKNPFGYVTYSDIQWVS